MRSGQHRLATLPKAVVIRRGKVLLARYEHDQRWELPGGPGDPAADQAELVLPSQLRDETGQAVIVGPEIFDFRHAIGEAPPVQVVVFGCHLQGRLPLQVSAKYRQVAWLPVDELPEQNLAEGYVEAIRIWEHHPDRVSYQLPTSVAHR